MNNLSVVEHTFQEATTLYENQEISREEYLNILQGLDVEKSITISEEEMRRKQELQRVVQNAITVVSLIAL